MPATIDKIHYIETHLGGPQAAAKEAGVSRTSWYRWSTGLIDPEQSKDRRSLTIINLLYDKLRRSSQ